ncbi:ABC transporter permease [Nocardioides sp. Root1257]|uniref:ABC transporter permease n=1 Tax=unclassified Nocardioides TaxID=2615069 RepID=UPI0006FD1FE7|nr:MULTISPECIES: ABC transporter permease [unclassified Nocardioides]KQW47304.1 ABC transporter permease [Nocardioides sp. Root1257]KRC45460.1 ABC transporter permease [Nocardioides sp. Root224]
MSAATTTAAAPVDATRAPRQRPGALAPLRWEVRKLRAQWRGKAVLVGALVLPVIVVVVLHGQSRPPKDTLFGRFATVNGFALALLVLGFAAQWVLPLLTAVVAGDIFASEDQHGTWKTVLTRSTSRGRLFWAKTLTAAGFAVVVLVVLAASTIASSVLIVGHQPLIGLSGQTIPATEALRLVALAWATMLPPMLGFTCLAILLSVWSRNPAVGIAAPVVIGMVMQLVGALGGVEALRPFLLTTPFEAWHGLLAAPHFTGPLTDGLLTSAVWCLMCLGAAYVLLRRRDITGG